MVVFVDEQSGGQLKLLRTIAGSAEVVQQTALPVEHLDRVEEPVHYVKIILAIPTDAFRPVHGSAGLADTAEHEQRGSGQIQRLNPEVHRVDDNEFLPMKFDFGGKIEFTWSRAALSDRSQNAAIRIQNEDLVTQRVGHVDTPGGGIHRDAGRSLEKSFPSLQASDRSAKLAA